MSRDLESHLFLRAVCAVAVGIVGIGLAVIAVCSAFVR